MNARYSGVKYMMSKAVVKSGSGYFYENQNYAVARLMIPRLWHLTDPGRGVTDWVGPNSAPWALYYVNEKLFAPAGLSSVNCVASNPDTAAHAYDLKNIAAGGALFDLSGPSFESCPSYRGLHMSAIDMVRWQTYLRYGTIVSPTVRQWMDTMDLGWRPAFVYGYPAGAHAHGGGYSRDGRSINTCHGKFPGNVEVAVVVNSQIKSGIMPCIIVGDAVKNAS